MIQKFTRRRFILASAGLGVLSVGTYSLKNVNIRPSEGSSNADAGAGGSHDLQTLRELTHPVAVGSIVVGARVTKSAVDARKVAVLTLIDDNNAPFFIELFRREADAEGRAPVATTRHYSLFLRNGGKGALPTVENQGLAVMAVADAVRKNETDAPSLQLITKSEFWA
jgi:hypothetical protein